MSLHFSANQYDQAFDPHRLQNWEVPSIYRQRPRAFEGFTQIVANDRGHLLKGVKRSRESPWGAFVGTWDMPLKIPGNNMTNSTARTFHAMQRLERCKTDGDIILRGKLKIPHVPDPLPVKMDKAADKNLAGVPPAPLGDVNLSAVRSGAVNPEPITQLSGSPKLAPISPKLAPISPKPASAGARTPLNWPRPGSKLSPKPMSPLVAKVPTLPAPTGAATTNVAVAGSPEPELQALTAKSPVNWPSPKSAEPPKMAA
ncbi:hypothetical protein FSP39_002852 [Pinctada imbricata]|uniref:Cilia- and flagella-associated protein 126 n=1 Tax=Pinctada imbricata TaxID=66713 RepID=A0AA88YK97_PINIB|nr:hypothetical protein FSP39_002852 [Pinctada imbricata]